MELRYFWGETASGVSISATSKGGALFSISDTSKEDWSPKMWPFISKKFVDYSLILRATFFLFCNVNFDWKSVDSIQKMCPEPSHSCFYAFNIDSAFICIELHWKRKSITMDHFSSLLRIKKHLVNCGI